MAGGKDFFEVGHYAFFVGLRGEDVAATVADGGFGVEFLFFFFEWQGEEGGSGLEDGVLEGARDAVAGDLEEAGGDAGGADVFDDAFCGGGGGVGEVRSDVDGWDVERGWGLVGGGHGCGWSLSYQKRLRLEFK